MKYVAVTGGLGNQMFIYAFMLNLRNKGYQSQIIQLRTGERYGYHKYELPYVFVLDKCDSRIHLTSKLFSCIWRLMSFLPPTVRARFMGFNIISVPLNFIYYPNTLVSTKNS